ncbi:MAG: hypothetical protein ABIK65_11700 [Candidatus Eisenbacteria bacterium]
MIPALLLVGFLSIFGQVLLLRELLVAFFGSELILLVGISFWMVFAGAGAWLGRRNRGGIAAALMGLGAALPATLLFARGARVIFGTTAGVYFPIGVQFLLLAFTLAPTGILLGFLFARAAGRCGEEGGSFATAYGIESLGGVAGGAASTVVLAAGAPASGSVMVAAALSFLLASFLARSSRPARVSLRLAAGLLLGIVVIWGGEIERETIRWHFPTLVMNRDSPYGRLTVTGRGTGQWVLFVNGGLAYDSESEEPELLAHGALVQREDPGDVLILGSGMAHGAGWIRRLGPRSITIVEPDRVSYELSRRVFLGSIGDEKLPGRRVIVDDERRVLRGSPEAYDQIIIHAPEPTSGAANRFYTAEFFRECARSLRRGGVLAFRLPSSENYWSPLLARRNGSVYRALAGAFDHIAVLPGTADIYIASNAPLDEDPDVLAERLGGRIETRHLEVRLVTPEYLRYLYENERFDEVGRRLRKHVGPPNTDLRPICYPTTLQLWLSRFHPSLAYRSIPSPGARAFAVALTLVAGLFLYFRRRPRGAAILVVGLAGFAGMIVEFAVILRFQTASGILYRDVGLLLGGFMAGLALSPFAGRRAARARSGGRILVAAFASAALFTAILLPGGAFGSLAFSFLWLLLTGGIVGAVYCRAAESDRSSGAPLYAADLIGGSAGALLGALFLLPFAGLVPALLFTAALLLPALMVGDGQ